MLLLPARPLEQQQQHSHSNRHTPALQFPCHHSFAAACCSQTPTRPQSMLPDSPRLCTNQGASPSWLLVVVLVVLLLLVHRTLMPVGWIAACVGLVALLCCAHRQLLLLTGLNCCCGLGRSAVSMIRFCRNGFVGFWAHSIRSWDMQSSCR